jgi:hypothetical protein
MPFRVTPTGLIECDTLDEAIALQRRLAGKDSTTIGAAAHGNNGRASAASTAGTGSFRDKVVAVISKQWASAQQVVAETGLDIRQVRGVINAPGLSDRIERRNADGVKEYHWKEGTDTPAGRAGK